MAVYGGFSLVLRLALYSFPCFFPYEEKQGKLLYAQLTTWSSIRAEDRFVSRFAWA